jgi:phage shock protein C
MTDLSADQSRRSPNRLYRNTWDGKLLGVCAGIADYFGFNAWSVRLVVVVSLVLFTLPTLAAYFAAGFLLDRKPNNLYETSDEERFWRSVRTEPTRTVSDLRHRHRELERRLQSIEAYVTSREFELNRGINDLDRDARSL